MGMSTGGGSPNAVKNDINVTPLIDVLLVLLIIFLVIIPIMMKMETMTVPRNIDTDELPDPDASQLTIKVHADLSMTFNDGNTETPINASEVEGKLRPKLEGLKVGKEKVVFVDYEDGVPWKMVVGTMDSIRKMASDASHDEIKVALKVKNPNEQQPGQSAPAPAPAK
jgi:biopolymer transport protein ExbD